MVLQVMANEVSPMQDTQRREEASARHDLLVAYVHALSDTHEVRTGVWMEHSYARARGSLPGESAPRVLLGARPPPAPEDPLDVERLDPVAPSPPPPLSPPPPFSDQSEEDSDTGEEGWEARVAALAPTATHARLAGRAVEVLRAQRLGRLAAGACSTGGREASRAAARRLRSALAPHWAGSARVPHWLHATLSAHLPRRLKGQYDEAMAELARAAPRLADRLGLARECRPASPVREECGAAGPWLAWVGDARWERRLSALVPTRTLRPPEPPAGPPEEWCAALAGAMRASLAEVITEAGDRGVVVGGAGAGAALGAWLASGARVRGLVLVAPALETAEGARDSPEDPLREVRVPTLVVCGAAGGSRARALCTRPARRLLEVRGADAALRVPRGLRRRARLTQEALDAAVAEECARWVQEVADGEPEGGRVRRLAALDPHQKTVHAKVTGEEDEFAHLVGGAAAHIGTRSVEVAEGRVVTRVSGGTPLALAPPRRAPSSPPGGAGVGGGAGAGGARLAPVDIMQMPIVFADDARARAPAESASSTSGASYSRVILAKRSAGGGAGGGAGAGAGAGRARGLVVRRGVRRDR